MLRLRAFLFLAVVFIGSANAVHASPQTGQTMSSQGHVTWVAEALNSDNQVGYDTRGLLRVFTTEGGLSTGLRRTFVSRDCPYFKVDVEFKAVGRPDRDDDGLLTLVEGSQDIIVKISRP
jgi:hypothetical protein